MGIGKLIPNLLPRRRSMRQSGFIALLDVIFASVGIFIAIIVIQAALIRAEDRPAEADLYAVLLDNQTILDTIADTTFWRQQGRAGEQVELPHYAWLQRVIELSLSSQRIIKIEIAHGADALDLRLKLEQAMNQRVAKGIGEGQAPPFTLVWRPLAATTDRRAYLQQRAFTQEDAP